MPQSVTELLSDLRQLAPAQYAIVEAVRAVVHQTLPEVSEAVKYGGILFAQGVAFGGVFAYKTHVSVEFSHGAHIQDTLGHLEGSGKGRRHLKLRGVDDIERLQLAHYLPLARAAAGS